jgi:hypothetical protein
MSKQTSSSTADLSALAEELDATIQIAISAGTIVESKEKSWNTFSVAYGQSWDIDGLVLDEISRSLKQIPSVTQNFDGRMLQTSPGAFHRVEMKTLSNWFVHASLINGSDTRKALNELQSFLARGQIQAERVFIISGVLLQELIQISPELELRPIHSVEPWKFSQLALFRDLPNSPRLDPHGLYGALVHQAQFGPISVDEPIGYDEVDVYPNPDHCYEFCRFLTLIDRSSAYPVLDLYVTRPAAPCLGFVGGSYSSPIPEVSKDGYPFLHLNPEKWQAWKGLFLKYLALDSQIQNSLRVPLERLNQSRRRRYLVDRAIDLAIALEATYYSGTKPSDRSSALNLRFRAANWGSNCIDERKRISNLVRRIYQIRSKAVHRGELSVKTDNFETYELFNDADDLIVNAILKVIELGKLPDWSRVELGGDF